LKVSIYLQLNLLASDADKMDMSLFEVENYKVIINSTITERRKTQKGLSKKLAEYLNVHPSMISQVLSGPKDFSEEQMILVCEFFGYSPIETQYLITLLQKERAGSHKLKAHFEKNLSQIRKQAQQVSERVQKNRALNDFEKAIFYSSWLYPTVHLLTTLEKKLRFEEICERLDAEPMKVREILDFLKDIGMVIEKDGKFSSGPMVTHLEKKSPLLIKHHTNWRMKAIQAAEKLSDDELMYTANFSISRKDFAVIREELMQTIQRFLKIAEKSPADDIAQFNIDLFWIK
jgi:uncharacterized protein (TIGR02147 family)